MATTLTEIACQVYALQARTSSAGAAVDDVTGEDLRLVGSLFSGGVVPSPSDAWQVRQRGAGANMSVDVGSGDADADIAIVPGTALGQGNYIVRREVATQNVTVPAAHVSSPRIDEVYLAVYDNAYDASSRVLPRLAYRDGTPAGSPSAPGPDAAWDAYLLLATISVPAGDTAITDAQITDERVSSSSKLPLANVGLGVEVGGNSTVINTALTSTFITAVTVTFTVPTDWNTYTLKATGQVAFTASSSGTAEARLLIGGNAGTTNPATVVASGWRDPAVRHERDGLTGNVDVTVEVRETAGTIDVRNLAVVDFIAVRTS